MERESINFICSITDSPQPFPHFWKHTVGSGHATLALRADWQKQLSRCHTELGFKHVRFHGVLSDDMGTLVNEDGKFVYSFFNADQICDFLLSIGMRPFMELSFMPLALASGNDIVFHYKGNVTPPRDYKEWETLIYTLVKHWVDRYGISEVRQWFFEIWNEPNLSAFWKSTKADYFRLYQHAARAIKKVDKALQVGGPATADNAWITDFLNFCKKHKVPADFISTHHYPTDDFGKPGDDTIAQLAKSKRSVLREEVAKTKSEAGNKPVYYTEWCTSSNPFDDLHDMPYAAAFITKTVMEAQGYVNCYSYWTFSDIFEENYFSSIPFHGGFGLLNLYGIPKPSYRAYQLLSGIGESILPVSGKHPTADIWITIKPGILKLLITNWALPKHPIKTEIIRIHLKNVGEILSSFIERIDDTHANARQAWLEMGQPSSLTPDQVSALELASSLVKEQIHIIYEGKSAFIDINMPPQGTACITLEIE
jgi:xylan 1,4-beta-xylosidase